ncbi:MAG: hypothetical protein KIT84_40065 [Labilithrix sp.]|nr:hypothetical protein [Labilithrix sp.]MCW5817262.1 hypothetical protein [Labilithrix sp.]
MIFGRVDEVDGHYVATKFVAALLPVESLYITSNSAARASVTNPLGPMKVKTDWRSVGLGYARTWLPALGLALPLLTLLSGELVAGAFVFTLLTAAGAAVAFRAGKLDDREKGRLRLLGTVTGLRIDPTKLLDTTRAVKRDSLGDLMDKGGIPMTPEGILEVIDDIPLPAMALVYGYACYASDEPEWRQCAELIYQRHEQADQ